MRKLCFAVAFVVTWQVMASDLSLLLNVSPAQSLQGCPIAISLSLKGQGDFTLPRPFGRCDRQTRILITDEAGRITSGETEAPCPTFTPNPIASMGIAKYHCVAITSFNIFLPPGRYTLRAVYESAGPYLDKYSDTDQRLVPGVWEGKLHSNEAVIQVLAPQGEDMKAWVQLTHPSNAALDGKCAFFLTQNSQTLLKDFPSSTYAAYVIHGIMSGFMQWDPNDEKKRGYFIGGLETGSFLSNSYPDDTGKSKDGWRSMSGKEAADWWAKWYDIILKNHSDIWFADELRLKKAVDQLALKNYQTGAADLDTLSKQAKPEVAEKAKQYLDLIKKKGWIKG